MFLWIEIISKNKNMQEIFDEIIKNKVLIIPGTYFNVTNIDINMTPNYDGNIRGNGA